MVSVAKPTADAKEIEAAEAYERLIAELNNTLFKELKDQAQSLLAAVKGPQPGRNRVIFSSAPQMGSSVVPKPPPLRRTGGPAPSVP